MYTVVRFSLDTPDGTAQLKRIGAELNKVFPRAFDGLDKVPGRFSCSVQKNPDWATHVNAMLQFIDRAQSLIREIQRLGGCVDFDTAMYASDRKGRNVTSVDVPVELARALAEHGIVIELSVY
jgi:hypothetical protein